MFLSLPVSFKMFAQLDHVFPSRKLDHPPNVRPSLFVFQDQHGKLACSTSLLAHVHNLKSSSGRRDVRLFASLSQNALGQRPYLSVENAHSRWHVVDFRVPSKTPRNRPMICFFQEDMMPCALPVAYKFLATPRFFDPHPLTLSPLLQK
jgi:hypothetical protein